MCVFNMELTKCCFFSFITFSLCVSVAAEDKTLTFTVQRDENEELKCEGDPLVIQNGGRFIVYITIQVKYTEGEVRCQKSLTNQNFWRTRVFTNVYTTDPIKVDITGSGDHAYECIFYRNCFDYPHNKCITESGNIDEGVKCTTAVHVQGRAEPAVADGYLSVNRRRIPSSSIEHVHEFQDGEGTAFTCRKITGRRVELSFTPRPGSLPLRVHGAETASLYVKLTAAKDNATLTCSITGEQRLVHVVTLRLILVHNKRGMLSFRVNGVILPPREKVDNVHNYVYQYYNGEHLTLGVVKDDAIYGKEKCTIDSDENEKIIDFITFLIHEKDSGTYIECNVGGRSNSKQYKFKLQFLFYISDYSPSITGLSTSSILLQYSNATSNMIRYSIGSEALHLNCVSKYVHSLNTFVFNPAVIISPPLGEEGPRSFQLRAHYNSGTVKCLTKTNPANSLNGNKITYLRLHRRPSNISPVTPEGIKDWVIVLIVLSLILLAAVGSGIAFRYKKRLFKKNSVKVDYRNLPENQQDSLTTPQCGGSGIHSDPDAIDILYAKPIPKNKRTKVEPSYAVPVDCVTKSSNLVSHQYNELTYASTQDTEPTYVSVQNSEDDKSTQKPGQINTNQNSIELKDLNLKTEDIHANITENKRSCIADTKGSNSSYGEGSSHKLEGQNSNDITYADVDHTHRNLSDFNAPESTVYSEIVPQNTYVNTLNESKGNNNGYVNADVKNDVEPAYCELSQVKL